MVEQSVEDLNEAFFTHFLYFGSYASKQVGADFPLQACILCLLQVRLRPFLSRSTVEFSRNAVVLFQLYSAYMCPKLVQSAYKRSIRSEYKRSKPPFEPETGTNSPQEAKPLLWMFDHYTDRSITRQVQLPSQVLALCQLFVSGRACNHIARHVFS